MPLFDLFLFFNHTATTEIYTLSLHDALPICQHGRRAARSPSAAAGAELPLSALHIRDRDQAFAGPPARNFGTGRQDRKSTRLNSSHLGISYAVFCLKKKKTSTETKRRHRYNK